MEQYHLISASDRNYLPYAFVAYQSMLNSIDPTFNNSSDKDELIFHIIIDETVDEAELRHNTDSFTKRNQDIIKCKFVFHKVNPSLFQGLPTWGEHKNYSTYYRLLIDKLIDNSIERILYFDIDVIFNGDVRRIFKDYPLEGKVMGAVIDPGVRANDPSGKFLEIKATSESKPSMQLNPNTYFNAGVLLINMNEWRKRNIGPKSIDLAPNYQLMCPDQDLLNYLVPDYEPMSWSCNFQFPMFYIEYNKTSKKYDLQRFCDISRQLTTICPGKDTYEQIAREPIILHFTVCKPWGSNNLLLKINPAIFAITQIAKGIEQWHQIASETPEYKNDRSKIELSGDTLLYSGIINSLIYETELLKEAIQTANRKRRTLRKFVIASILLTLILYIIHFAS